MLGKCLLWVHRKLKRILLELRGILVSSPLRVSSSPLSQMLSLQLTAHGAKSLLRGDAQELCSAPLLSARRGHLCLWQTARQTHKGRAVSGTTFPFCNWPLLQGTSASCGSTQLGLKRWTRVRATYALLPALSGLTTASFRCELPWPKRLLMFSESFE